MTGTDLATDVSRRTDRTSYSIPEDGSPVIIPTKKRKEKRDKEHESMLTRASHQSQTSLLIEYFEGGKGPNVHSRPSVRVKVTPSGARRIKDGNEHIQITEAGGSRKPSFTRRISLGPKVAGERQITESADDRSISSYTSAAEDSSLAGRYPPVEIEVMHRDQGSDVSAASAARQHQYVQQNPSEISSMPPDSMLDANAGNSTPRRNRSRSVSRDAVIVNNDTLKTPSRRRSRSLSRERLTQKVIEKLGSKPRESSHGKHRHGSKPRSRSVSNEQISEHWKSPKRRSSRHHHEDEVISGVDSSVLTNSQLSSRRKSGDQYSFRSGTSKSSINNPKLLETVEDAIRRLILPELTTLKQEQKMQQNRNKFERDHQDPMASGTTSSREGITRSVSKHASAPDVSIKPKVVLNRDENNSGILLSGNSVKGKKEYRKDKFPDSPSERSFERDVSEETVIQSHSKEPRRNKGGYHLGNTIAGGVAGAVLTSAALRHHDSTASIESQERKRRRSGSKSHSHSRRASLTENSEEIFNRHDVPPMPMRSDIYSSEVTRDSILSERTEEPSSPSEQRRTEIRQVSRGSPREVLSPSSRTPTRTPVHIRKGLGTRHSNLSRGDLSIHSAHSDASLHEENRQSMVGEVEDIGATSSDGPPATDHYLDDHHEHTYAYRAANRGLSPIQSVASYKEESELLNRYSIKPTQSSGSLSSLSQQHGKISGLSINSLSSAASTKIARSNRPKAISLENGQDVLDQHGLRDSNDLQKDPSPKGYAMDDWYERQHEENDRYRDSYDEHSLRNSTVGVRHMTDYTDDSMDAPYLDKVTAAQQIQGLGANPEYVRTPVAVESAVASLLDPSILSERSKLENKSFVDSLEDHESKNSINREGSHKDINLSEERDRLHGHNDKHSYERLGGYYEHSAANSPRQSVTRSLDDHDEHIMMGTSALPVANDPMPEIGQGLGSESDLTTNPSIIKGYIGGVDHDNQDKWPYQPTPPQSKPDFASYSNDHSTQASLKAAADGMLSTAALLKEEHERLNGQDRSRDVSLDGNDYSTGDHGYLQNVNHDFGPIRDSYMSNQPIPTPPKDEGYQSAAAPGGFSPEPMLRNKELSGSEDMNDINNKMSDDDPFVTNTRLRHVSANSHGLPSPLYDSATGGGIDRIHSKDIVALMDHVSVHVCTCVYSC